MSEQGSKCPLHNKNLVMGVAAGVVVTSFLVLQYLERRSARIANERKAAATSSSEIEGSMNEALLFIKPHANLGRGVTEYVVKHLMNVGATVTKQGTLSGDAIAKQGSIDQHYSVIGTYATKTAAKDLPVTEAAAKEFAAKYKADWKQAVNANKVIGILDAMDRFKITSTELASEHAAVQETQKLKLAPGCYVTRLPARDVWVINAFFAGMRAEYVDKSTYVDWITVTWPESTFSWKQFRAAILGATNPKEAASASLRRRIMENREKLGLPFEPTTSSNCVHGSASPLEAMKERRIWLGLDLAADPFGKALLGVGMTTAQIEKMLTNPVYDGQPLFDAVEDMDTTEAIAYLKTLKSI